MGVNSMGESNEQGNPKKTSWVKKALIALSVVWALNWCAVKNGEKVVLPDNEAWISRTIDSTKGQLAQMLLTPELQAATLDWKKDKKMKSTETIELTTSADLLLFLSELNISDSTYDQLEEILISAEKNPLFVSKIVTDDKTLAVIEIYKVDWKIWAWVQEMTILSNGDQKLIENQ